jgi:isopenicillin-N epimerase
MNLSSLWGLDPPVAYLNHGSFGACPRAVLEFQTALQRELEHEPCDFLSAGFQKRIDTAREQVAAFLGADPADLVFVTNSTAGVNAVLRSLHFTAADEILMTTHTYNACRLTIEFVAARTGVKVVVADLPFPLQSEEELIAPILERVSPRTRLALLDHISSPTALVMPIARLVGELNARAVDTLVDGAHAPGQVPIDLSALNAAYYTGNAHKWLCAPKGAAILHVRRDRQAELHPTVISHGYPTGFHAEFDWTGTCDPTPWLCIPECIRYLGGLLPGGWPELMAVNHALALQARALLMTAFNSPAPCPETMIGSMASLPLPLPAKGSPADGLTMEQLHDWFRERGVETWLHGRPIPVLRLSCQLYNRIEEFKNLARLFAQALHGR